MLEGILSAVAQILFFAAIPAFIVGTYQQHKFLEEWREDHAQSLDWFTMNRLSTTALLSNNLSERCRDRRRKLAIAIGTFLGLVLVGALLGALLDSPLVR
jgi:hypothetical protein